MAKSSGKAVSKKSSGKRTLISPNADKRYVKRDEKGRIKESDDQGNSLSQDVKQPSKNKIKPGYGDKGDQPTKKSSATKKPAAKKAGASEMEHPQKPLVFISYSHKDEKWVEELLKHIKPLKSKNLLDCWSDKEIKPGSPWQQKIQKALISAKVAVLLVSPSFLASDFIEKDEFPPLLNAASNGKIKIIWIPISFSMYKHTEIAAYQAAHNPKQPLDTLRKSIRNQALVKICDYILQAVYTSRS